MEQIIQSVNDARLEIKHITKKKDLGRTHEEYFIGSSDPPSLCESSEESGDDEPPPSRGRTDIDQDQLREQITLHFARVRAIER